MAAGPKQPQKALVEVAERSQDRAATALHLAARAQARRPKQAASTILSPAEHGRRIGSLRPMDAAGEQRVAELERGFRRAGLPLFIEDYSASTDVFNRVVGLLGLVFAAFVLLPAVLRSFRARAEYCRLRGGTG